MKLNSLIYIIIAVLVVGAIFFVGKKENSGSLSPSQDSNSSEKLIENTGALSMRDLVSRDESVRCTFVHDTEMSKSSGEVFVAQGKIRGNFDVVAVGAQGEQPFNAYMISDGDMSYIWSSVLPQGVKIPLSQLEEQSSDQASEGISYNTKLNYSCEPWQVDNSVFVPPTSVSFVGVPQTQ